MPKLVERLSTVMPLVIWKVYLSCPKAFYVTVDGMLMIGHIVTGWWKFGVVLVGGKLTRRMLYCNKEKFGRRW